MTDGRGDPDGGPGDDTRAAGWPETPGPLGDGHTESAGESEATTPAIRRREESVADEEDGRTAASRSSGTLGEYTTDRRSLSPRVQLQWGVRSLVGAFVLGSIVSAVAVNFGVDPLLGGVPVVAGLLTLATVWVVLRYRAWVYQVRRDALYLERGVATHVRTLVPYVRIQHVDTSRGPFERLLGLSTLVVYTAGSRGADVSVPGLTPEEARDLQQRVKELAIEAEGGDAL